MSDSTVRLKIKIEGSNSFKEVEVSAEELADAIVKVKKEAHNLNERLLNANQISQAFEQIGSVTRGLQSAMHDLTAAYSVQASAEARLEQMMRNTMDATDEDIQSIKDLASAQQQLGVIGDEVILSGAQELATYMQKKDSLEALIPLMNDMVAQQYGYNASAESAVSVAQMMGKVFTGETGALKRLGYTFDEAQEQILKFGTEEEKVATLTEVIGQIVDGTNAKLANTPFGKIARFSNDLGDIKEQLGRMVAPAMNAVESIASVTIALAGIAKGVSVIKATVLAFKSFSIAATAASLKAALLSFHSKMLATAQRLLAAAGMSAAAGTTALRIAVTALYAAMTLGLSLVIQGVITLISNLAGTTRDATIGMKELEEANEAYKSAIGQAKAEIEAEIASLKRLIDANGETTEAVKRLNDKYGEVFGNHQTASEWYDILTQKSQLYCRQLGYEAKAKSLAASIGAKIVERDAEQKRLEGMNESYTSYEYDDMGNALPGTEHQVKNREWQRQKKVVDNLTAEIETMEAEMNSAFGEAGKAADELKGKVNDGAEAISWQEMNYEQLGKAIQAQEAKLKQFSSASSVEAQTEKALFQSMKLRYDTLGRALGLVSEKTKEVTGEMSREPVGMIPALTPRQASPLATSNEASTLRSSTVAFQNLEQINRRIQDLQQQRLLASKDEIPVIDAQIAYVERLRDEFEGISKTKMPDLSQAWSGIKGVGSSIRSIKDAITETDNAWDALTQTVDGFISLFQSFTSIIEIIRNITAVTKELTEQKKQETAQTVEGNVEEAASELGKAGVKVAASNMAADAKKKEATANVEAAVTGAASSVASIPLVGAVMAVAAVASVIAALASLPKFASGAVVYGPTLGLMGEYAGASSNPEVIAPLSKLQGLIGGQQGRSEVKFRIEGRELVGILNKQSNINRRNG